MTPSAPAAVMFCVARDRCTPTPSASMRAFSAAPPERQAFLMQLFISSFPILLLIALLCIPIAAVADVAQIVVPVTLTYQGKSVTVSMAVDTGASVTTIDTSLADQLGVAAVTGSPAALVAGANTIAVVGTGNIYIIEDQPGGQADIWFATDANRDGVAESIARWATMSSAKSP
mgnify:CR=1 FL=1